MTEMILTSSALILSLVLIRKLLRRSISPSVQYALWLLVAARLLIPGSPFTAPVSFLGSAQPLLTALEDTLLPENHLHSPDVHTLGLPFTILPEAVVDKGDTVTTYFPPQATAPTITRDINWLDVIWKGGMIAVGSLFLLSNTLFCVNLHRKRRLIPAAELPLPCRSRVYQADGLVSPCLFGLPFPAIYLDSTNLSEQELTHILIHEETHHRHGDHLWALLRCLCLTVHWFNPLVWWAAELSRRDCELSCDAGAIHRLGEANRISYGETLLRSVIPGRHPTQLLRTATTMSGSKKTMTERITLITRQPKMLKITLVAVILLACGAAVFFFGGAGNATAVNTNDQSATEALDSKQDLTESPTENAPAPLTEDGAIALFRQAREIWNWFEFGTLPTTDAALQAEGGTMQQVADFDSLDALRRHLDTYFSPNLTDHLLANYAQFQESDGALFVLPASRTRNLYAGKETAAAFVYTEQTAAQQGVNCRIAATTEVMDLLDPEIVLYLKHHDWYIAWNGQNYVFASFGPYDDVDPQKYYNVLTILDHYNRGSTITTWYPVLANLDWNALYATRDQWPTDFDLGMYIIESIDQYITEQGTEMTAAQYTDILSATEGLDGAYSEGFGHIVYRLYTNSPALFAHTVLEDLSLNNRNRALDLFRFEEVMRGIRDVPLTREETSRTLQETLNEEEPSQEELRTARANFEALVENYGTFGMIEFLEGRESWNTDDLLTLLAQKAHSALVGSPLETHLDRVVISEEFSFPKDPQSGQTLQVPVSYVYRITLTDSPLPMRVHYVYSQEMICEIGLYEEGGTMPEWMLYNLAQSSKMEAMDYYELEQCASFSNSLTVPASDASFDVNTYIRETVLSNLKSHGLDAVWMPAIIECGSYRIPSSEPPGTEQTISYSVTFSPVAGNQNSHTVSGELVDTTTK